MEDEVSCTQTKHQQENCIWKEKLSTAKLLCVDHATRTLMSSTIFNKRQNFFQPSVHPHFRRSFDSKTRSGWQCHQSTLSEVHILWCEQPVTKKRNKNKGDFSTKKQNKVASLLRKRTSRSNISFVWETSSYVQHVSDIDKNYTYLMKTLAQLLCLVPNIKRVKQFQQLWKFLYQNKTSCY